MEVCITSCEEFWHFYWRKKELDDEGFRNHMKVSNDWRLFVSTACDTSHPLLSVCWPEQPWERLIIPPAHDTSGYILMVRTQFICPYPFPRKAVECRLNSGGLHTEPKNGSYIITRGKVIVWDIVIFLPCSWNSVVAYNLFFPLITSFFYLFLVSSAFRSSFLIILVSPSFSLFQVHLHFCLLLLSLCFSVFCVHFSCVCIYFFLSICFLFICLSLAVSVFLLLYFWLSWFQSSCLFLPPFLSIRAKNRMGGHFLQLFSYDGKYLRIG